jgi:glycosyltransferase involved in cell wall biosynthesis
MLRVLVVCEYATLNGGERSLLAVLPTLQRGGWQMDFVAPPQGALAESLRSLGIAVVGVRDELPRLLTANRYDLVHANSLAMALHVGPIAATAGLPSIGHLRDIVRLSGPKISQLNASTRLLAVSSAVRDYHVAQGLDAAKTHVQYNGIGLSNFLPTPLAGEGPGVRGNESSELRKELGLTQNAKLIGLVGQIILRKGQDTALAALVPLLKQEPLLNVVIVGERHSEKPETIEFERGLHAAADRERVADRVHFLGTRTDISTLLPQLNLLLHMARQEPLGRVLLEAAACGVPVVATDVGGTREIFPRGAADGALLVPKDDAEAARDAVKTLLAEPIAARSMGMAGRRRIEAAFSVEQAAAGLLRHYNETAFGPHEPGCSLALRD